MQNDKAIFLTKILIAALFNIFSNALFAQPIKYAIANITFQNNTSLDTITFTIVKNNDAKMGSLMFVASANTKQIEDTFFFPFIDSLSLFELIVPASLSLNNVAIRVYYHPLVFRIYGKVLGKFYDESINALIITDNKKIFNKVIAVNNEKEFALPALVFEDKASLIFNYTGKNRKSHPNVSIQQFPLASQFKELLMTDTIVLNNFGNKTDTKKIDKTDSVSSGNSPKGKLLQSVTVKTKTKSVIDKFNDENSNGLFKSFDERIFDGITNNQLLAFNDCISFLSSRIAGLQVKKNEFGETVLIWRGQKTNAFYIDEIPVDIEQLEAFPVSNIAMLKVYPPPFFGSGGSGSGGGVAIYSKKGLYRTAGTDDTNWLFSVRGYNNPIHILHLNK